MTRDFKLRASKKDDRDIQYKALNLMLSKRTDLRLWDSIVESQGNLNSCVGNAITNAFELMLKLRGPENFVELSRLFVYYQSRLLEDDGSLDDDGVYELRNALKACKHIGVCSEELWPYEESRVNEEPSAECYQDASLRKISSYQRLPRLFDVLEVLHLGRPVITGVELFSNFEDLTIENPVIRPPEFGATPTGPHAMCIVGYSIPEFNLIIKNSYGKDWGDSGYCYMPFDYYNRYVQESWCFDIDTKSPLDRYLKN